MVVLGNLGKHTTIPIVKYQGSFISATLETTHIFAQHNVILNMTELKIYDTVDARAFCQWSVLLPQK